MITTRIQYEYKVDTFLQHDMINFSITSNHSENYSNRTVIGN